MAAMSSADSSGWWSSVMNIRLPKLRRLARDERGVSLIELGLVAPFLSVLLMGCIDLGMGLSRRYDLQQAAHRTIELANVRALTAASDSNEIDFSFIKTEAMAAGRVDEDQVTLTRWLECDGEVMEPDVRVCPEADQKVARYIQLEINDQYEPMFELAKIYPITNRDGTIQMTVEAAVRIQ
jgi:Flp pilus assembly pilin Flp